MSLPLGSSMLKLCGSCRHWKQNHIDGWGDCTLIKHCDDIGADLDVKAKTSDYSGYNSSLWCRHDFGYILHDQTQ